MNVFLSHNKVDREEARSLGAQLKLVGADVWFDEWEIKAGDSIVGAIDDALQAFDCFVLIWSGNAAGSVWVRAELEAALTRRIQDSALRIVPIRLDATPLPPLLQPLRHLDFGDGLAELVDGIMGFTNDRDRIMAIQSVLDAASIRVGYFYGYGAMVGCPNCGAGLESIKGWHQTDDIREDEYAGAECKECGWSDGGEV